MKFRLNLVLQTFNECVQCILVLLGRVCYIFQNMQTTVICLSTFPTKSSQRKRYFRNVLGFKASKDENLLKNNNAISSFQ